MPKQTESMYAETLHELGFVRIEKELSRRAGGDGPSPRQTFEDLTQPPWCIVMDHATFVTDETGRNWMGPAKAQISHMGFRDITEEYEQYRERRIASEKGYN